MRARPYIYGGIALALIGWLALMVSFWLPEFAHQALMATALSLMIPGTVSAAAAFVFWEDIENYQPSKKPVNLRCIDCGKKVLNAAGTTIGDQIEDEVMMLDPPTSIRDPKGNWHPPDDSPFDRRGR